MVFKKKLAKKKGKSKAVKAKPIKVAKGKKPKAIKSKQVKRKPVAEKIDFDAKAASLHSELRLARQALKKNDSILSKKLDEKNRLENSLNTLLSKNFAAEKVLLSAIKTVSAKKQAVLRKEISSLKKINSIYAEKKARIDHAKQKQNALKKQLQLLEKKAGA